MPRNTWTDLTPKASMLFLGIDVYQKPFLTKRELLAIAVIALDAADRAREEGNFEAERYYCTLAHKCDDLAAVSKD